MKNIQKFFLITFVCLFQINSTFAIQCHYCNSLEHPKECGKKIIAVHGEEKKLVTDCGQVNPLARINSQGDNTGKTDTQSLLARANFAGTHSTDESKELCFTALLQTHDGKEEVYVRDCGFLENEKQQCAHITEEAKKQNLKVNSCKTCSKGLCNSANNNINVSFIMVISIFFYYLL